MEEAAIEVATDLDAKADKIIKSHMRYAMVGGVIPLPLVDLATVTIVQLDMLKQLARSYNVAFDAGTSRAFVTSVTSALGANAVARTGASLAKALPGVGWIGGGIAQAVLTGASTYAVGNLFKRLFRENRPIEQLDFETVKDEVSSYFEKGKAQAAELRSRMADSLRNLAK